MQGVSRYARCFLPASREGVAMTPPACSPVSSAFMLGAKRECERFRRGTASASFAFAGFLSKNRAKKVLAAALPDHMVKSLEGSRVAR